MTHNEKIDFIVEMFNKIEHNRAVYLNQEGFENLKLKKYSDAELVIIKKYCGSETTNNIMKHMYNELDYELISKNITAAVEKDSKSYEQTKNEINSNNDMYLVRIILENLREGKPLKYMMPKSMHKRADEIIEQNNIK